MKAAFLCALDATTIFNTFLPIHVGVLWHYWRCSSSCCLIYCSLLFYVYPKTNVSHQEKEQRTTKIHFFLYLSLLFLADLFNQTTRENMSVKWALCQRRVTFSTYLLSVSLFTQRKSALLDHEFIHFPVPNVKIFGDRDIFVKSSSTVQLRCVVSQSLVPPTYIEWRHNEEHLPLTTSSLSYYKGARLQTTPPEHIAAGTTVSTLTILAAEISDSGKYTCLPAQLEEASVNLHVLESK